MHSIFGRAAGGAETPSDAEAIGHQQGPFHEQDSERQVDHSSRAARRVTPAFWEPNI